jgi:thioredoxin-related protein
MNKFILFSKDSCGPCMLVEKYFRAMKDERTSLIKKVDLEDATNTPIPQENLNLAKQYGVTATPVLVVTSPNGLILEKKTGGLEITQNIRKLFNTYLGEKQ